MRVIMRTFNEVLIRIDTVYDGQFEAGLRQNAWWQHLSFCRLKKDRYERGTNSVIGVPLRHNQKLPAKPRNLTVATCGQLLGAGKWGMAARHANGSDVGWGVRDKAASAQRSLGRKQCFHLPGVCSDLELI